jgi:O-antigen/teichoic acid export membrane protein
VTVTGSITRTGILSMVALVAVGGTRLVHGSLVSHHTDRATYGTVGIMLAATTVASLVMPGGLSSAMAKFVAYHRGAGDLPAARAVHRFLSRLAVLSSVLLGVAAAVVVAALYHTGAADTLAVGLLTVAYSLYTVDKAALYGFSRVPPYVRLELGTSAVAVAGTVAVVAAGWHGYLLPLALGYGLFVIGARWLVRADTAGPAADRGSFRRDEVLSYVGYASVGTLSGTGFLQGTQLIAAWFVAADQVAYVTAAVALVAPLYFLPRALGLALFPALANAHGAGDMAAVRRDTDRSTRALAAVLAPVFVAAEFLAPQILRVFGGHAYVHGAGVLRLILAATYLAVLQVPAVNALASGPRRQARIPALCAVAGCLVGLAVVAALGPTFGATGVALGYLVGSAVTAGGPLVAVWRSHAMPWRGPLARALVPVAAAVAVAAVVSGGPGIAVAFLACVVALLVLATDLRRVASLARQR